MSHAQVAKKINMLGLFKLVKISILKKYIVYIYIMVSIKGCRGCQPLMNYNDGLDELGLTSRQKAIKRYLKTDNGKAVHSRICKKYQQPYHCDICNRDLLLGQRARHNRTKIHLSNM